MNYKIEKGTIKDILSPAIPLWVAVFINALCIGLISMVLLTQLPPLLRHYNIKHSKESLEVKPSVVYQTIDRDFLIDVLLSYEHEGKTYYAFLKVDEALENFSLENIKLKIHPDQPEQSHSQRYEKFDYALIAFLFVPLFFVFFNFHYIANRIEVRKNREKVDEIKKQNHVKKATVDCILFDEESLYFQIKANGEEGIVLSRAIKMDPKDFLKEEVEVYHSSLNGESAYYMNLNFLPSLKIVKNV